MLFGLSIGVCVMTILPVLKRELVACARRGREIWGRSGFAFVLLAIVLATFATLYYQEEGHATNRVMERAAYIATLLILAVHAMAILDTGGTIAARCLSEEKERRTLDFLLTTDLKSHEIILGKFAACMVIFLGTIASGLPMAVLLVRMGGVDVRLILYGLAGIISTAFLVNAFAIWISTNARDNRRASSMVVLCLLTGLWVPVVVAMVLPRIGLRPPWWVSSVNLYFLNSNPFWLMIKAGGVFVSTAFYSSITQMCRLQLVEGLACLLFASLQLRWAYRSVTFGEASKSKRWYAFLLGRARWRPAVSDDPIFWRERYTGRASGVARIFGLLLLLGGAVAIGYPTWFFARPAFAELWKHGYLAVSRGVEPPEFNLFVRFFAPSYGPTPPVDIARTELNLFLRLVSAGMAFFVTITAAGYASEGIASERSRESWSSLLATPLMAREILASKLRSTLWKLRLPLLTLASLWGIGLLSGALHPLGFVASILALAAGLWLPATTGMLSAIQSKNLNRSAGPGIGLSWLLHGSVALPFLLPSRFSSILLGAGSPPLVIWLSLLSYRDVALAWRYPAYPHLRWIGIMTSEGWMAVVATYLASVVLMSLAGFWAWRYLLAHFDQLVGRPWRQTPVREVARIAAEPADSLSFDY